MKYTVHGGHAPHGKLGHGAVGFCSESTVDRAIKNSVISWLKTDGHLVVDCTCESAGTQSGVLSTIKKKINAEQNVTANISIHLNANKKVKKDGKVKGCECWVYPGENAASAIGTRICTNLGKLGFPSRGIKSSTSLAVLKGVKNGGANVLVEAFFCDDEDDFTLYSKVGISAIGKAIAEGVVGHSIGTTVVTPKTGSYILNDKELGNVDLGAVFNPSYYANTNKDVLKAIGSDDKKLFEHFCTFGMKEGRKACADFNVYVYKERYEDLKRAYGQDLPKYYKHYCLYGKKEGRKGI